MSDLGTEELKVKQIKMSRNEETEAFYILEMTKAGGDVGVRRNYGIKREPWNLAEQSTQGWHCTLLVKKQMAGREGSIWEI